MSDSSHSTSSGVAAFLRFIEGREESPDIRRLWTIAVLVSEDERLWNPLKSGGLQKALDEELLESILLRSDVWDAAGVLWSSVGQSLSVDAFSRAFNRLQSVRRLALPVVHRVLGAAVDFLRSNRGALRIRRELAERLLESQDCEHRIIALKALCRHCDLDTHELVAHIATALKRRNWFERCGAIAELRIILDEAPRRLSTARKKELITLDRSLARIAEAKTRGASDLKPASNYCREVLAVLIEGAQ